MSIVRVDGTPARTTTNVGVQGPPGVGDGVALDLVADSTGDTGTSYHAEITTAIQSAGGGIVRLNGGTYYITSPVTIEDLDDTIITGPGTIRFIDTTAFQLLGTHNVRFQFVTFEYVGAANPTTARAAYLTNSGTRSSLRNRFLYCRFKNAKTGIHIYAGAMFSGGLIAIGNEFDTEDTPGSVAVHLEATDSQIFHNKIHGYETGILADNGSQQIQGNHIFKGGSASIKYCVRLNAPEGIQLTNNYFDNAGTAGVYFYPQSTTGITGVLVSGNYFLQGDGNAHPFISFGALNASSLIRNTLIAGNTFRQLGATENTTPIQSGAFIDLANSTALEVHGNTFSNTTRVATRFTRDVTFAAGETVQAEAFPNLIGNIGYAQVTGINAPFYYGSITGKTLNVKVASAGGSERQVFVEVRSVAEAVA